MMQAITPPAVAPEPEVESYRWQIVVADSASLALLFSASEPGVTAAGLTYVLGGPVIHGAHGEAGRTIASLVLRVGLPILGGACGAALTRRDCGPDDYDCDQGFGGFLVGFGLGILTAMVVDTAVIARPLKVHRTADTTWAPRIAVTPQHVGLGVMGRF